MSLCCAYDNHENVGISPHGGTCTEYLQKGIAGSAVASLWAVIVSIEQNILRLSKQACPAEFVYHEDMQWAHALLYKATDCRQGAQV